MRNIILSPSSINTLQSCSRKFKYTKIDNIIPVHTAPALEKGSLMHFLLERFYRQKQAEIISGQYNKSRLPFIAADAIVEGRKFGDSQDLTIAESESVINYFRLYVTKYQDENWIPISIEQPFTKILFEDEGLGLRAVLQGKIDLQAKAPDGILIVDHKTSSRNSQVTKLSNQFIGYCWAHDVKLAIRNNIVYVKDETKQFSRDIISYTQDAIDEWYENTVQWIIETDARIKANNFPMNLSSCNFCSYRSLCETDRSNRDWRMAKDFKKVSPHELFEEGEALTSN